LKDDGSDRLRVQGAKKILGFPSSLPIALAPINDLGGLAITAIRRRMNLIPFLVTIADDKKDKQLCEKLKSEWPGILNWMIEGCLEWQRIGLAPPKAVLDATNEYLEGQDTLQTFLEDCCVVAKNESDSFEHLWDGWVDFAEDVKEPVGTKRQFGDRLTERGFKPDKEGKQGTRIRLGLRCIRENKKRLMEALRLD
jgi:putative DNA primase/helicase